MSLALDDLPRDPDQLLCHLQQMAEVIARQNASLASLQAERDTILTERDAICTERDLVREERNAAQAEIEKLRLLIRQLQRGQFGRRSEMNGAAVHRPRSAAAGPREPRADRCGRRGGTGSRFEEQRYASATTVPPA